MIRSTQNTKHRFICLFATILMMLLCIPAFAENTRPRLGLSVSPLQASPILLQHLRLAEGEGLTVENIAVGGELEAAGLSQGDIVIAIDGKSLTTPSDLTEYLDTKPNGSQVTLDVIQKGDHRQIYVKLDSLPDEIVWKYARPVAGPGRTGLRRQNPQMMPFNPFQAQPGANSGSGIQTAPGGNAQISSRSVYKSVIRTDEGTRSTSVTISGPKDDPSSEIEIVVGDDSWKTTIGEIDDLPETPKKAAQNAIRQGGSFSFSFGSSGGTGDDFFDEMIRRQQKHMQMMDEFFNQQMQGMPQIDNSQAAPLALPPSDADIQS